eukprot:637639-Amorphochlora_amoeboformis.AAC.4
MGQAYILPPPKGFAEDPCHGECERKNRRECPSWNRLRSKDFPGVLTGDSTSRTLQQLTRDHVDLATRCRAP